MVRQPSELWVWAPPRTRLCWIPDGRGRRSELSVRLAGSEAVQTRERPPGTTPPGRVSYREGGLMKITIEIPDAEVHRVLAPLLHKDALPSVDEPGAAMPGPAMMRIGDAANHLALSRHSPDQLVARGAVPSVKIGRSLRPPAGSPSTFFR